MLVWEVDELESLGLPPKDADIVIFFVKHYLPVRWIVTNPKAYKEKNIPSAESCAQLNLAKNLSVSEIFATFLESDLHSRESWERSVDDPRMRAHMLNFICKIAPQHHSLFENAYAPYQLRYKPHPFLDVVHSFRHPFTGGLRPKKRATAEQQRGELLKNNVRRVLHEMYCQIKEEFPPTYSFNRRLEE